MELEKLQGFVLLIVLVGMLIGIGVLVTDKFGGTAYYNVLNYNDSTTITTNNTFVALDHGNITNFDKVVNQTDQIEIPASCYSTNATGGRITVSATDNSTCRYFPAQVYSVVYDYKEYDTETRAAMAGVTSEISGIATNWLGLIVTVSVLAIILFLVMSSFGGAAGRRK